MTATQTPKLNAGQKAAADGVLKFLLDPDQKECIISGPGGVGKTFLMGHIIDTIIPQYTDTCKIMGVDPVYTSVAMTATTNKAAGVLGVATGRDTSTIQSFMNLRVYNDYKTGKTVLARGKNWQVHTNIVLFIDESSFIDQELLNFIREGTIKCKIIYVGDHCQLAPIMEKISPIYTCGMPFFELTEPMRSNIPELHALNNQLRNTVESGVFSPIQVVPGIIDWMDADSMEAAVQQHFIQESNHRILAYTNERVSDYNKYIRQLRNITTTYVEGEHLINNNVLLLKDGTISVEEEVQVLDLSTITQMIRIEEGVELEVRYATMKRPWGVLVEGVALPEDRDHFNALKKYYKGQKNWNRYYYLHEKFPDLRPRDASTMHKSQGSTYDCVFIDLGNLSSCHNPDVAARLLYVSASRAKQHVILYGDLAEKYGGIAY